jgi:hypothetical protein
MNTEPGGTPLGLTKKFYIRVMVFRAKKYLCPEDWIDSFITLTQI